MYDEDKAIIGSWVCLSSFIYDRMQGAEWLDTHIHTYYIYIDVLLLNHFARYRHVKYTKWFERNTIFIRWWLSTDDTIIRWYVLCIQVVQTSGFRIRIFLVIFNQLTFVHLYECGNFCTVQRMSLTRDYKKCRSLDSHILHLYDKHAPSTRLKSIKS